MSRSVLILGGGIAGLSTAHELRQQGFDGKITILEQNASIGGDARSSSIPNTGQGGRKDLPTEHSWRVYFQGYWHLFRIMKQIPTTGTKTVFDNLVPLHPFVNVPKSGDPFVFDQRSSGILRFLKPAWDSMSYRQRLQLVDKIGYAATSSKERIRGELGDMTWNEFIDPQTKETHDYLIRSLGPFLGTDWKETSASSAWEVYDNTTQVEAYQPHALVANGPTSEVWFDHWHRHLEAANVTIRLGQKIQALVMEPETRMLSVVMENGDVLKSSRIVSALPAHVLGALFDRMVMPTGHRKITQNIIELGPRLRQSMVGVQLYFDETLTTNFPKGTFYLVNSEWQVLIEPQSTVWDTSDANLDGVNVGDRYGDGTLRTIWSLTLCDSETPGRLHKKPFTQLSRAQIVEETMSQIRSHPEMNKLVVRKSGQRFSELEPFRVEPWKRWIDNASGVDSGALGGAVSGGGGGIGGGGGGVTNAEPKSSPNVGTWKLRPTTQSDFPNLVLAGVFTRNSREMLLMDAAAESGVRAAHVIMSNRDEVEVENGSGWETHKGIPRSERVSTRWVWLFQQLDAWLYSQGYSHLARWFGGSSILMILASIVLLVTTITLVIWALV